jgi:diguanylate cyclase (GGDEF)-like protein/PAS domain S-box-containing protein
MMTRKYKTLPRRVVLSVVALLALLLGTALFIANKLIDNARDLSLNNAQEQVARFAAGAQTGLNRSLLGVDVMLASVDDWLQTSGPEGHSVDALRVSQLLRSGVEQTMLVRNILVLSKEGQVIASSDQEGLATQAALPERFWRRVLESPAYTVVVSETVRAQDPADQLLYFGRTVKFPDGKNLVVVVQVPTALLTEIMTQGGGVSGIEVTLERGDGVRLVSVPDAAPAAANALGTPLSDLLAAGTVEERRSRLSGDAALLTVRRTLYRSLWITVALPMEKALASWRSERQVVMGAVSVISLLILLAGVCALWYLARLGRIAKRLAESKAVLDQALNSMDSGFFVMDSEKRIVQWNQRYEEMVPGLQGQLWVGMPYVLGFELVARKIMPDADELTRSAWVRKRADTLLDLTGQQEISYPDGRTLQITLRRTPDGGTVCVANDVTADKRDQTSLRVAAVAFESQEGMIVTDAQHRILRVNQAFTAITGYCASDVVGRDQDLLSTGMNDAALREVIWSGIHGTGHWQGEVFDRRKGGELFPMHLTITAVKDEAGTVTHYVTAMTDITLRKAAAKEIERLAFLDPLTGLPNRRLLLDRLQQALSSSARSGRKGALLFLDLDHFKVLNDTLGHDFGDLLLRQVAQRLSAAVREGDTVARLGGDEFVVLLEDLSEELIEAAEQAQSVGEKVLLSQQQPYTIATHQHHSSCSMGAVVFGGQHQSVDELLKQADLAMYDAKAAGRNALRFFDPQMQASISARAVMENELHAALAAEQFVLHYQTQVTNEDQVIGAEVLIRWQHPQRGLVSPAEFISLAEETGLINPIGWWVLQTACAQLKAWEAVPALSALQLAVNVSARQFHKPDFVTQVMAALQQSGARSNLLKLELTESVVLKDIDDTIGKMNALKALGVRFSLDDFGTGQSSLSYLTQLPLDQIKIDRSFVQNIGEKPTDALIVQTIIGMARNLGLEVIAEGVETQAQRSFLEQHGCTLYQGYLFSRPVPIQQFERSM